MGKIDILKRALRGELIKFKTNLLWKAELLKIPISTNVCQIIVSMTSYGDRVSSTVPYTVMSILRQSVRPKCIVLWLDKTKWNDDNIPPKLRDLEKYGLLIRFCTDVRSYTKLVHAIREYPDDVIVTVDDDLYYSKVFLEELYMMHKQAPSKIITLNFCYPAFDGANNILPYKYWQEYHCVNSDCNFSKMLIFPQGFGGILYPPKSLHPDVTNASLFQVYAPYADDLWFYIMGLLNNTQKQCVIHSKTKYYYLDLFRQIGTRDRLHDINVGESQNDIQLKNILTYYKISLKDYE